MRVVCDGARASRESGNVSGVRAGVTRGYGRVSIARRNLEDQLIICLSLT